MSEGKTIVVAGKGEVCRQLLLYLRGMGIHIPVVFTSEEEKQIPQFAEWLGIKDIITEDINLCADYIKELAPDYILSFQYHKILKPEVISIPKSGCINLHFGMLPQYRGMAPIAHAMINGDEEIGVTLHYIDQNIDTGDIISINYHVRKPTETAQNVYRKVCEVAVNQFKREWPNIIKGEIQRLVQSKNGAHYYTKDDLDFSDLNFFKPNGVMWSGLPGGGYIDDKRKADWLRAMIFPEFQTPYILLDGVRFHITEIKEDV